MGAHRKQHMKICIESQEDGTYLVGVMATQDTEAPEMSEGIPEEAGMDQGMQPAASLEEALQMAGEMLQGPQPTE